MTGRILLVTSRVADMVKALTFKGDKKSKKRKSARLEGEEETEISKALVRSEDQEDRILEEDDSWVTAEAASDITGPVIIVLPTTPSTCIACDANGKVFTSTIENMVEGDPATAEPHDVRQVWVASRIAGTEYASFKGHHGRYEEAIQSKNFGECLIYYEGLTCLCFYRYLGSDKFGILSAFREAISAEESFLCIVSTDTLGTFNIQTQRDKFFTVNEDSKVPEIRADAEIISFKSTFRVRMQARFKPTLNVRKENKAREKISRRELEAAVGRRLDEEEVRRLKRARREGEYHETILDVRVKGKHDKFAS